MKFDINKVITVKDYLINPNCVEVGKKYFVDSTLRGLKDTVENNDTSCIYSIGGFINDSIMRFTYNSEDCCDYLYPYEEPVKKYRPFKKEELLGLLGKAIKRKIGNFAYLIKIIDLTKDNLKPINIGRGWLSCKEFLNEYEFINADGTSSPCGVLEEEE